MIDEKKEEFEIKLAGPKGYAKKLNRLAREKKLIELKIEQAITEAYYDNEELRNMTPDEMNRSRHIAISQLDFLIDSECKKSPYGLHATNNFHQHIYHCSWCEKSLDVSRHDLVPGKAYWRSSGS